MDKIDNTIISVLEKDSRTPFLQIANKLNISEGTIRTRVKKLFDLGEIKRFTIDIKKPKIAIIGLKINTQKKINLIENKLFKLGIDKVYHTSGKFDVMFEIKMSRKELNNVLDQIRIIDGVLESETFMILEESEKR